MFVNHYNKRLGTVRHITWHRRNWNKLEGKWAWPDSFWMISSKKIHEQANPSERSYLESITDDRQEDENRSASDQVVVSIILANQEPLQVATETPQFRWDEMFKVVPEHNPDDLVHELNKTVCRDVRTGRTYSVMHQITSRRQKHQEENYLLNLLSI